MERPRSNPLPLIRIDHSAFGRLHDSMRRGSLGSIHLGTRAITALEGADIRSIGNLLDQAKLGISGLWGLGNASIEEIQGALEALAASVQEDGGVDWLAYARRRKFLILPNNSLARPISPTQFVQMFPEIVGQAVASRFPTPACLVFRDYLLQGGESPRTMEELSRDLGRTKQAVSLLKNNILAMLQGAILKDDYSACCFRFRAGFVLPLRRLAQVMAGQGKVLPYSKWKNLLDVAWGLMPVELGQSEALLLELLGYQIRHRAGQRYEPLVAATGGELPDFIAMLQVAERLLRVDFPSGLSGKSLVEAMRARGQGNLSARELTALVRTIPSVEDTSPEGTFRLRVDRLYRMTDRLERILQERGRPMKGRELVAELGRRGTRADLKRTSRQVGKALSEDKRFESIGRTGIWMLAEWGHETGTVADVAARLLRESGSPLTEAQLCPLIAQSRPVKYSSILTLLLQDGRFRRVAPRTWELKDVARGKR